MNEQNQEINQNTTFQIKKRLFPQVKSVAEKFKILWFKFYSNKKIFWPVSITFGLLILTIILGLVFGNKKIAPVKKAGESPTPFSQITSAACAEGDNLCLNTQKLSNLKGNISDFDPAESKLSPPVLNFDINF